MLRTTGFNKTKQLVCSKAVVGKSMGFFPGADFLKSKSAELIAKIFIKQVDCRRGRTLLNLTFIFSDDTASPPKNSYFLSPSESFAVQKRIGSLELGQD